RPATPRPRAHPASRGCARAAPGARRPRAASPPARLPRRSCPALRAARSQEALSLTPVGGHLIDDALTFQQVHDREALAQLTRLRVAQVHAVADREALSRGP